MFDTNLKCYKFFSFMFYILFGMCVSSSVFFYLTMSYVFLAGFGLCFGTCVVVGAFSNKYFNKSYQLKSTANKKLKKNKFRDGIS